MRTAAALLAAAVGAAADCPVGCPAKCPDQRAVQSEWVRANFSLDRFWGTFYELQFHDNTQPAEASCQRSVKSFNPTGGISGPTYKDLWSIHIYANMTAVCDLEFNISDSPGVFLGHWRGSMRPDLANINNTVIDVGVAANGTYTWVLEFQCAENATGIAFAAVNFYHRLPLVGPEVIPEMERRARALGIGWLLDTPDSCDGCAKHNNTGLTVVNQSVCVNGDPNAVGGAVPPHAYPSTTAPNNMCGQ